MRNLYSKIELFSNIAIIAVALLLGAALVNRYFLNYYVPQTAQAKSPGIKPGTALSLPDADWNKNEKTLVVALSTTCRYCTESLPFYKLLAQQKAGRGDLKITAVLPQSADEARRYLSEHNVSVDEIKQADLPEVRGTPTLIIVDKNGSVLESWVGKLPPEKETEVMNRFFGESSGS
jgi:thioredoxin-related protein